MPPAGTELWIEWLWYVGGGGPGGVGWPRGNEVLCSGATALKASANFRFGVEWADGADEVLPVSSADGSGGERMDCRDVIVKTG